MGDEGPYTFAEREAAMFPAGPHWILRGLRLQGLLPLSGILVVVVFSSCCIFQALRTYLTGQRLSYMPWIAAASLLPVWVGVSLTFEMLRVLPHYTGVPSYHHDKLGAIRVTLFTCLVAGLTPAALALAAWRRHSPSPARE